MNGFECFSAVIRLATFSHDNAEGRRSNRDLTLLDADFFDGSEMLTKYPLNVSCGYRQPE